MLVLAAVLVATPASLSRASTTGVHDGASSAAFTGLSFGLFSSPSRDPHSIRSFENHLIDAAARDAAYRGVPTTIEASFYHLTDMHIATKLVHAEHLGVEVRVLLDGSNKTLGCHHVPQCVNPAFRELELLNLGTNDAFGWMRTCDGLGRGHLDDSVGQGNGCIGQDRNHNKFILVSNSMYFGTSLPEDVVIQTSLNNTHAAYTTSFNDALVTVNEPNVYDDYRHYFDQLAANYRARTPPPVKPFVRHFGYQTDSPPSSSPQIAAWSFPRQPANDPIASSLSAVETSHGCRNSAASATDPKRGAVAIAMFRIHGRPLVMRALGKLRRKGCDVQVIYADIGRADRRALAASHVGLHELCKAGSAATGTRRSFVHSKYVLIAGNVEGIGHNKRVVYTGSDNLDDVSLTKTDDRLVRYIEPPQTAPIFEAYAKNFLHLLRISKAGSSKHCARLTGE
jgi:phosphatidylserine/phosphatidylglycerophosphate/cardiolipin synthase-like enzyme